MHTLTRRVTALLAALVAVSGLALFGISTAVAAHPAGGQKPTIVLVHGAFADGASWNPVVERLQRRGFSVVAVANPLRGVRSDAEALDARLATIDGPVVLVGHSYGGAVITNTKARSPKVKSLVYVAAFAPAEGEAAAQLAAKYPGSTLGETLAPVPLPDGSNDLYIKPSVFRQQFAADVPARQTALMAATQRPIRDAALNEASGTPAWASTPSWFLLAGADKNIPLRSQQFMADRAGSRATATIGGASHAVAVSRPDAVADLVLRAAG
ncbi:Pimeloyl-ACP methyl ester carboxylesterase [Lentzea xinjiangensis]|uniref:Pimeloyl-ACP methyl ester carboxylesterase n=1 Tax=Lentzea xinjiangensis TaxID=402600 RepID=A0A1H9J7M1_9PSEU|nr:alpha/beta hydrolase [Lentzea xinjiangensis]SEQ82615.1 Pimeloyl-ACP methyl ester carboxylesterase [Lentzea xinjiangensis]